MCPEPNVPKILEIQCTMFPVSVNISLPQLCEKSTFSVLGLLKDHFLTPDPNFLNLRLLITSIIKKVLGPLDPQMRFIA